MINKCKIELNNTANVLGSSLVQGSIEEKFILTHIIAQVPSWRILFIKLSWKLRDGVAVIKPLNQVTLSPGIGSVHLLGFE